MEFGYLGGLFSLGMCLVYIRWAQYHGQPASSFVPAAMLITAALFALTAAPTFVFLRERAQPAQAAGAARAAWARVHETLRHAHQFRDLRRFLLCTVFYQAGIAAVIALAAIYAQEAMHFTTQQTITLVLVVNVTAAAGAFAFGYLQDAIGHIRAVALTLVGWIVMIVIAGSATGAAAFWVAANIAGLCMGSSQAAGRAWSAYFRRRAPARVLRLVGPRGKTASIFGPLTYGLVTWISPATTAWAFSPSALLRDRPGAARRHRHRARPKAALLVELPPRETGRDSHETKARRRDRARNDRRTRMRQAAKE